MALIITVFEYRQEADCFISVEINSLITIQSSINFHFI